MTTTPNVETIAERLAAIRGRQTSGNSDGKGRTLTFADLDWLLDRAAEADRLTKLVTALDRIDSGWGKCSVCHESHRLHLSKRVTGPMGPLCLSCLGDEL